MRRSVAQPYFFPDIGHCHLIAAADRLILYNNIKSSKNFCPNPLG